MSTLSPYAENSLSGAPVEIITHIISYNDYKDLLSLKMTNKRLCNIIRINIEKRRISNDYIQRGDIYQSNREGIVQLISKKLPFHQLPWKYQTSKKCFNAIKADYRMYDYVKDKTDAIRLCAANYDAYAYFSGRWNFRTTLDVAFIKRYAHAIKYVENQTEELCYLAIGIDVCALKHVRKQTREICLFAMRHPHALEYVKDQTYEICLMAIRQEGCALKYVKNQTYELCLMAVKQNGCALQYVKNQTLEICFVALYNNHNARQYVNKDILDNYFNV